MARRMQETGRGAGRRRRRGGPRRRSPPGLLRRSSTVKTLLQACCGAGEEARPERLPLRGSVGEQGCGLQERPSRRFGEEDGAGRFGSGEDEAGRFGSGDAPSSIDVGRRRAEPRADDGGEEASLAGASGARRWGTRSWGGGRQAKCRRRWGDEGRRVPPTVGSLEGRRGRRVQIGFGEFWMERGRGAHLQITIGIRVTETMAKQCSDVFLRVGG